MTASKTTTANTSCDQKYESYLQTKLMQTRFFILFQARRNLILEPYHTHHFNDFFSFLQTGTHYFAKWGEVTSWILKSAERLSVFCFALRDSASSAQQRAALLSSAVHESSVELRAQWTKVVHIRPVQFTLFPLKSSYFGRAFSRDLKMWVQFTDESTKLGSKITKTRVSVQGVKSLGSHFACLCRGLIFMK